MSIDIRVKKVDRVYREGELLSGVVVVHSKGEMSHQGVTLFMEGAVNLQLSAKSVGLFEAFYNSLKPIELLNYSIEIRKPGKFPSGSTQIPFEFPLKAKSGAGRLYETYHGVFVNVQYTLRCDMKRSLLSKDLTKSVEFIIEYPPQEEEVKIVSVPFTISPDSITNAKERHRIPSFKVTGKLDSASCLITKPFTGEIVVEQTSAPIKSIELQLCRIETCGCAEGFAKDATEIQNIQVGEGNVCPGLTIPLYMIFPRLFTCPTIATKSFKIEFEVNVVIVFMSGDLVTENFPIKLVRA